MADRPIRLNLGCGNLRIPSYQGVDFHPGPAVDRVMDIASVPWPFADSSVERVIAWHFMEHLAGLDLDRVMREIARVLIPGGILYVKVPLGLKSLYDPFHFHAFDRRTFDRWCSTPSLQAARLFRRERQEVVWINGFPLWHLAHYVPRLKGIVYEMDERGAWSRVPWWHGAELREWLAKEAPA